MRRFGSVLWLVLLSTACAGAQPGPGAPEARRNVIAPEEVEQFEVRTTARQMIRRLHPSWLEVRGPPALRTAPPVAVYVNRQRRTEADVLDRYTAGEVREIRYLNGIDATTAFGTDHGSGAILITLR